MIKVSKGVKKQIVFPIAIKKTGVPFVPPAGSSLYYILASDGFYLVRKNKMYETCVKVNHDVPGYEKQEEYCRTNLPILPNKLMDRVMSFFRTVYDDLNGEAIVELFLNEDTGEWLAIPPYQGVPEPTYSTAYRGGYVQYGLDLISGHNREDYGDRFEDHAHIAESSRYERWDNALRKWAPCKKGEPRASKVVGTDWHDLLYKPTTLEEWPDGFTRMGTIHSHKAWDAYFSSTDDADDRYGDGMHLVFGHINEAKPTIKSNVKASFCANGQRFQWEKKDNDDVCEEFIDPDADFPGEWLKRCHEVEHVGDRYVSVKPKRVKAASEPKPVKGSRAAKKSNIRMVKKGKA